ncbi:MAG: DUF4268 domain-containing protein [Acidiferrobacter sp.]
MKPDHLSRLTQVPLREVFASEAADFTPWLAQDENLKPLGEDIGIDLALETQEKEVGPFRADILCRDMSNDSLVLIQNQPERTDHTHLGQLLTYAAGLEAVTILWVAERLTEEHRAALDWLNERTDERINLFGLEIELWRIGGSPVASKFNAVCKPNDWARSVRQAAIRAMSEVKGAQLKFWIAFRDYMTLNSTVRCQKPYRQHWINHPIIGRVGAHLVSIASTWNSETEMATPEIRVEPVLDGKDAKRLFEALESHQEEIDPRMDVLLTWYNPDSKNMCCIYIRKDSDFRDPQCWPEQHVCLKSNLELFTRVSYETMISFMESIVEDVALARLKSLGYVVKHGSEIALGEPTAEHSKGGLP